MFQISLSLRTKINCFPGILIFFNKNQVVFPETLFPLLKGKENSFLSITQKHETMLSTEKYIMAFSFLGVLPLIEVKLHFQYFAEK